MNWHFGSRIHDVYFMGIIFTLISWLSPRIMIGWFELENIWEDLCPSRDTSWTRDGTEWNRGIPKQYRVKSRQRRDHCILMMTSSFLVFSRWCCRTCVRHSRITVFSFFLYQMGDYQFDLSVFPMVVSILSHAEFGRHDHWESAPHFNCHPFLMV